MRTCNADRMRTGLVPGLACALFLVPAAIALADGTVSGTCWFERIKGRGIPWTDMHEWHIYLIPSWSMFADPQHNRVEHGSYSMTNDAGSYTVYVNRPEVFARPKLITGVQITDGQTTWLHPEFNLDYSCYYDDDAAGYDHTFYQTFIATGTSINKIAYRCDESDTSTIGVTLLVDTGGNVTTWLPIGETKYSGGGTGENWVGYRSGELPTNEGQVYAIRLAGQGGSPNFSPYWRTDNGDGYADGQAYAGNGNPFSPSKDLNILVFSDNDGTVMPYMKMTQGNIIETAGWEWQWGQTFKSIGNSLAAVDMWFTIPGYDPGDVQMWVDVYENPPDGQGSPPSGQVGIRKRGRGDWHPSAGLLGVSYEPGEVPLTAGQTYYIEFTPYGGPTGFTAWKFDNPADAYPDGHAYPNRGLAPDVDLNMNIMEYADTGPPPELLLSDNYFETTTERGSNPDDDHSFTVSNSGGGTLYYWITHDAGWLSVDPSSGALAGEEEDLIQIIYSTCELEMGVYWGTITVEAPGLSPEDVTVKLTVIAPTHAPCDFDEDDDVDMEDFGKFQTCLSGSGTEQPDSTCAGARLEGDDDDVDRGDLDKFLGCMTGANQQADPLCADD